MGSSYAVHPPSTTPRSLHVVPLTIGEERATYDARPTHERVRLTVIEAEVVRDVCRDCGTAAAMYFLLETYADANGECWPSYDTLAEGLGITRRQAIRLVAKLEAAGYVFISERRTARKHNQTNLYTLPYHRKARNGGGDITSDTSGDTTSDTTSDTSGAPESPKVVVSSREVFRSSKGVTPPTPSPEKKPPRAKPKTSWPDDLTLTDELRRIAIDAQISPDRVDAVFEGWRDAAGAKGYRYVDWTLAWRNWVKSPYQDHDRVGAERGARRSHNANGKDIGLSNDELDALIRGETREETDWIDVIARGEA
jgi:hypothetical protein